MAHVYRARVADRPQTPLVAVKRLGEGHARNPSLVDMFTTEADIARMLRHPNLVNFYDAGLVNGEPYLAMEYLEGLDLSRLLHLRRRIRVPVPAELATHIAGQVLRALDYVHGAKSGAGTPMGIIHRDVTPENIFLTVHGEVKLGDFGVAKIELLSRTHTPLELHGKVRYLPPEVLLSREESQALDLWSLASVIYEMVTLTSPYGFVPEDEILSRPRRKFAEAHKVLPSVPEGLSEVLARALHPKPRRRYQSALEFWRDLSHVRASLGARTDPRVLSRFVCEVADISPSGERGEPAEFDQEGALKSFEQSMTQRIHVVSRRGRTAWGRTLGAAAGGIALGLALFFAFPAAPEPQAQPPAEPVSDEAKEQLDLAAGLAQAGDYARALVAYEKAQSFASTSFDALLGRAQMTYLLGDYSEAKALVDELQRVIPDNPRALLLNASVLRSSGHPLDAKAAFQEVVAAAPESDEAAIAQATLDEWQLGDTDINTDTDTDAVNVEDDPEVR